MCASVIANGFPKSGTNLLATILDLLEYRQVKGAIASSLLHGKWSLARRFIWGSGDPRDSVLVGVDFPVCIRASRLAGKLQGLHDREYISAHSRFSSHLYSLFTRAGAKVILVIRDPRDIAVSHAHYCAETPAHPLFPFYQPLDFDQRLKFSLAGGGTPQGYYLEDVGQRIQGMDGWIKQAEVLTVKFEALVGARGGGDAELQKTEILRIAGFLGLQVTEAHLASIQEKAFGTPGRTFRRGQIGSWKEHFKEEHIRLYTELAAEITEKWGYQI
jgi:hypothetical protein